LIHDVRFELIIDLEEILQYPADRKDRRPKDVGRVMELGQRVFGRMNDSDILENKLKVALGGLANTLGPEAKPEG
jgi:hypothetical protein